MIHRRERIRIETVIEIKKLVRQQMALHGAASFSLRMIAKQMGFTSQALYRYYPNRNALISDLIVDACENLASALEFARDNPPKQRVDDILFNMLMAYRQWAVDNPIDYSLIYCKSIPDYKPSVEIIDPAIERISSVMMKFLQVAWSQGKIKLFPEYKSLPLELEQQFSKTNVYGLPNAFFYNIVVVWCKLHGLITSEIFSQLHQFVNDYELFYRFELITILKKFGLEPYL